MAADVQTIKFLGCSVISFTSSIGFNGNPSTLSVTMAEDFDAGDDFAADSHTINNELGATYGGSAFSDGNPGTYATFKTPNDSFVFKGFVTSYRRSKSVSGNLINVELSDPRFFFANIPIINDTNLGINNTNFTPGTWNIISTPAIFNNPITLDWNKSGVRFDKLAKAIEDKTFNLYLVTGIKIVFHQSFYSQLIGGYRLKQQASTVEDVINQAAKDANIDWYLEMGESEGLTVAYVKGIKRKNQYNFTSSNGLETFISSRSDKVVSWEVGRELRQDPTTTIVTGDRVRTLWNTSPNGNFPVFCELGNGAVIDRAFVCLDFLKQAGFLTLPTVNLNIPESVLSTLGQESDEFGNTRQRYPSRTKNQVTRTRRGYIASESILRAALYNKASWETAVWYTYCNGVNPSTTLALTYNTYNSFDLDYGFDAPTTQTVSSFSMNPNSIGVYGPAFDFDTGNVNATTGQNANAVQETLKEAVYQATRRCAEEYYGKKFICRLPESTICESIGSSYEANQKKIPIEYDVVDAAPDIAFYDSQSPIGFPNSLLNSDGKSFRAPNGLFRPFLYVNNTTIAASFNQQQYEYLDPNSCIWAYSDPSEQGGQDVTLYHSGVSVETYRFDPRFAIVTLNEPILLGTDGYRMVAPSAVTNGAVTGWSTGTNYISLSRTDRSGCFLDLLSKVFYDFTIVPADTADLNTNGIRVNVNRSVKKVSVDYYLSLQNQAIALQSIVGLAEVRLVDINSHGGFFIPLVWNYIKYGPWVNGLINSRPVNVIDDNRLNPWTYGNYARMNDAGDIIAERANTLTHTISYATVVVEGYPEFNLGSEITAGTDTMGSISDVGVSFGIDGVKTTYKFKTFFGPIGFSKKSELDQISQNSFSSGSNKNTINLESIFENVQEQIYNQGGGFGGSNSAFGTIGVTTFVGSVNNAGVNGGVSMRPGADVKNNNSSNTSNYGKTAKAEASAIFIPCTTRPPATTRGEAPTIEGGL
jgi:hypothetical protein